jgi:small-conductance mechanosensitive channel
MTNRARAIRRGPPGRALALLLLLLACACGTAVQAQDAPVFEVERINPGLASPPAPFQLATPQSTLDFFVSAVRESDFDRAAHALNLAGIPIEAQARRGPELARKLGYVVLTSNVVRWSEVPDTPAARLPVTTGDGATVSEIIRRRVLRLGMMEAEGREMPIQLQRLENAAGERVWLFARTTVTAIPALYDAHGSGPLVSLVPREWIWRAATDSGNWRAYLGAAVLAGSVAVGLVSVGLAYALGRILAHRSALGRAIGRTAGRIGLLVALVTFSVSSSRFLVLDEVGFNALRMLTWLFAFVVATTIAWRLLAALVSSLSLYFAPDDADENRAMRGIKTHIAVAQRVLLTIVAAVAFGVLLQQFGAFSSLGLSLAISTGLFTAILLLAARPIFANLVSATQIAGTKPVEIGDVVTIDDRWGRIEDIAFSYVVVRTWTNTRLIVPHDYLLSHPFENWSRESDTVMREIDIYVDYHTDVDAVRRHFEEIVARDPRALDPSYFAVSELRPHEVKLQAWVTGESSFHCWQLHNDVRERLLQFVQDDAARRLPRLRHMSQVSCEETAANLDALKERPSKAPRSEDVAQADAEGD